MVKARMTMDSLQLALSQVPVFQSAGEEELRVIAAVATRQKLEAGMVLFCAGDTGDALYVVESGNIKISRITAEGKERILRILGQGEVIGEMALFDEEPRSADAVAMGDTLLIRLPKAEFLKILETVPQLAIRLLAVLAARLRMMNEKLEDLTFLDARRRIARLLVDLAGGWYEQHEDPDAVTLKLKLTHEEMAALVGTSRETVSRVLGEFQETGTIYVAERVVHIRKWNELKKLVETG